MRCAICGSYFAPVAQLEHIKGKLNLPEDIFDTCPDCRRKSYASAITALGHIWPGLFIKNQPPRH